MPVGALTGGGGAEDQPHLGCRMCQSALVATGWLATMLLRELTQAFNAAMLEAPNAEVVQVEFDPAVVKAFVDREERLRAIRTQFAA